MAPLTRLPWLTVKCSSRTSRQAFDGDMKVYLNYPTTGKNSTFLPTTPTYHLVPGLQRNLESHNLWNLYHPAPLAHLQTKHTEKFKSLTLRTSTSTMFFHTFFSFSAWFSSFSIEPWWAQLSFSTIKSRIALTMTSVLQQKYLNLGTFVSYLIPKSNIL